MFRQGCLFYATQKNMYCLSHLYKMLSEVYVFLQLFFSALVAILSVS
jgi:hypothetical protein